MGKRQAMYQATRAQRVGKRMRCCPALRGDARARQTYVVIGSTKFDDSPFPMVLRARANNDERLTSGDARTLCETGPPRRASPAAATRPPLE